MYVNKMVFAEITREQEQELSEMRILQYTDYGTNEITADNLQARLEEIEEEQGKEKFTEVLEIVNDAIGSNVTEMLRNNQLDFVMVV